MKLAGLPRFLGTILIIVLTFCILAQPAVATILSVVVDSKEVALKPENGGAHTGKVTLINLTDSRVDLEASIEGDEGSVITLVPSVLEPGRRTDVALELGPGCEVANGCDVTLAYLENGVATGSYVLKATSSTGGMNWSHLLYSFLFGLVGPIVVFTYTCGRMRRGDAERGGQSMSRWARVKSLKDLLRNKPLKQLSSDWSFKDNWLSSMTLISGALVGLLGTSGALEAMAGSEPPKSALSLLAIAGALSAFLAVAGPFFLKGLNHKEEKRDLLQIPTVGGTLWAALLSLLGALGLVACVVWQGMLVSSGGVRWGILSFGVVVYALVSWYAAAQLWRIIRIGTEEPTGGSLSAVEAAAILEVAKVLGVGTAQLPTKTREKVRKVLGEETPEDAAGTKTEKGGMVAVSLEDVVRASAPRQNALI